MSKKIICFLTAAWVVFSGICLSGCGEKRAESIYFLNSQPELAEIYEEISLEYENETGKKLKIVTTGEDGYQQTLKSEIAKSDPPAIFHISGPEDYDNWKDYCLDLKDSKIYSYLMDKQLAIKDGGGVYAVPYTVEGFGIVYNNEITDRYFALENRKSNINSMDEVNSFEKFRAVAEDMSDNLSELGIKGVFACAPLAETQDWSWQYHLMNIPLYYEISGGGDSEESLMDLFDTDEIKNKYSENFRSFFDLYINNSASAESSLDSKTAKDAAEQFALGQAAMMQGGSGIWQQISGVKGNKINAANLKMLPIYIGAEGETGQGICIGSENYFAVNKNISEEQQTAALDFLQWLFSDSDAKRIVTEKLEFSVPFNTFSDASLPEDPIVNEVRRYMNNKSVNNIPWIFTAFPKEDFGKAVNSVLSDYAKGEKTWSDVQKTIIEKWKEAKD